MPVPTAITDLSTTASSNSPPGSEGPASGDDYIRAHASFIATLRDKLNGTSATGTITDAAFSGTHTFSSGTLFPGTYTPTVSNTTNVGSSTVPAVWQYLRVGSVVIAGGWVSITATAAGAVSMNLSIPVASNFASGANLTGSAISSNSTPIVGFVQGDTVNDKVSFSYVATGTSATVFSIFLIYRVI